MNRIFAFLTVFAISFSLFSQESLQKERPRLVVGIVVDQMRYDYLTRFYDRYGEDGFKRLMREGFYMNNAHYNYIPTATAVGHASIYTGTTGNVHGILGNDWYDKFLGQSIYCVYDPEYAPVGTQEQGERKSPYRLHTTTITDELRLAQNMRGKTISMGLKDRSSVLPGGHTANASYWYLGGSEGKFISSSFYMAELPEWVVNFNQNSPVQEYINKKWETLYPIDTYVESISDDNDFEEPFSGETAPVFPHDLSALKDSNGYFDILKSTPFGNTLLVEFAKAAIENEQLGSRGFTDFLTISFSSPDYIGHQFGVDSKEIQDTYLRLDKDLGELLRHLDKKVGEGEYTLFLTADHAAVAVPAYLASQKVPAGYIDGIAFREQVEDLAMKRVGSAKVIENISNLQVFLNREELSRLGMEVSTASRLLADGIINLPGVYRVVTAEALQKGNFTKGILYHLQNGYNQKQSGDIMIVTDPATVMSSERTGSQHGSGFSYDTHVPIIFFGKGIQVGKSRRRVEITDIAPTLSSLLQIAFPNGCTGQVIEEVLR